MSCLAREVFLGWSHQGSHSHARKEPAGRGQGGAAPWLVRSQHSVAGRRAQNRPWAVSGVECQAQCAEDGLAGAAAENRPFGC